MFGVLLGTLNKFKDDSEQKSEAVSSVMEIFISRTHKTLNAYI